MRNFYDNVKQGCESGENVTQLQSQSERAGVGSLDAPTLFTEARPLHRKRQITSTVLVVTLILGASVLFRIAKTPHVAKVILFATLDASRTQTTTVPKNPKSEVITTTIDAKGNGGAFSGNSLLEEAITLNTATPSARYLAEQGSACSNAQFPCQELVHGVSYFRGSTGMWIARQLPINPAVNASPNNPINNIATFRKLSLGSVVTIGRATIGGIPTTEYRATVSLINLYATGQISQGSLVGEMYVLAHSFHAGPPLSAPIEIWADQKGQILEVRASATQKNSLSGSSNVPSGSTTQTTSVMLSDFNVPVHAVAPPANEVTNVPLAHPTQAAGKVFVKQSNGTFTTGRGLLVLSMMQESNGVVESHGSTSLSEAVDAHGTFVANVIATSLRPGSSMRVSATFYPNPSTKYTCAVHNAAQFVSRKTTQNFNFICS